MTITEHTCRKCGTVLRGDALQGLCRRCLAKLAFESFVELPRGAATGASGRRIFGDYELLSELARGGMGVVYKARQISLNRVVALKMILHGPFSNEEFVMRFQIEAEAIARLHHPHIVTIYEIGEHDGHRFLSMEYIAGQNFADLAAEKPLPPRRAAAYLQTVAQAIHYAHQQGIIHRDLKPSNLLLDLHDQPRVTDFGLAKLVKTETTLTLTGQALGSPGYIAPECATGKSTNAGATSDVYSLGAVLYYLLTGHPPFQGSSPQEILLQMRDTEPVAPRRLNPLVPVDLETICLKCLQPDPNRRYSTAVGLADDLGRLLGGEPIHARPVSQWEKMILWCRRRPIQTALSGALALAMILGIAGIFFEWRQAEANARGQARERLISEDYAQKIRLDLYAADINLAAQAIEHGDYGLARRTLAALQPSDNETDLRGFEWRYLSQLAHGNQLATFKGHTYVVTCTAFSPDGRTLATGGQDGTVKIWDVKSQDLLTTLPSKKGAIWSVGFSPDGKRLMAAGNMRETEFWSTDKWQLQSSFPGEIAVLSPTGPLAAISSSSPFYWEPSGKVSLWNYVTGEKIREFSHDARALAISSDGKTVAASMPAHDVELWDVATGRVLRRLPTEQSIWSLAFSPDGRQLVAAGWSNQAFVWNLDMLGASPSILNGHLHSTWSAAFSPDGKQIVTTSSDQTLRLWDAGTLQTTQILRGHGNEVWCATFSPDGRLLASGGKDQMAMLWAVDQPETIEDLPNQSSSPPVFSPDGRRVAVLVGNAASPEPQVWDVGHRQKIEQLKGEAVGGFLQPHNQPVNFDSDQIRLNLWTSSSNAPTPVQLSELPTGTTFEYEGFSASGEKFFGIDRKGSIRIWETATGRLLAKIAGPAPPIRYAVMNEKQLALSLERENFVRLYDIATGNERPLAGHRDFVGGLAFSPDGHKLASGSMDGTLKLWDCANGHELATLPGHLEETTAVAFSPDGNTLASVGRGESIKLWHLPTLRELLSIDFPRAGMFLQFTPDGSRLAITTEDNTLHFFEAPLATLLPTNGKP